MSADLDQTLTAWDNSSIYQSYEDPALERDLSTLKKQINELEELTKNIVNTEALKAILLKNEDVYIEISTLEMYAYGGTSVNAKDEGAKKLLNQVAELRSKLTIAMIPADQMIKKMNDLEFNKLVEDHEMKPMTFNLEQSRFLKDYILPELQEKTVETLSQNGLHAWGRLYNSIAGSMECQVGEEKMGLANASNILFGNDRSKRELAWRGIQQAWTEHEESAAAILNGINGWRLDFQKMSSHKKELHYLDQSCHQAHITRKTLDSLLSTTYENRSIGQRALAGMAKNLEVKTLAPWDIGAAPLIKEQSSNYVHFKDAIDLIAEAFSQLSPEMGDFVQMMYKKNWIDGKPSDNRSPGAYCGGFERTREPRIFMTYDGSMTNITTLAHELGHAYHSWVMKDLKVCETHYAMTTAETASTFGETLVREYLYEKYTDQKSRLEITWDDAISASIMICNIPARFELEKSLVEKRKEGFVPASQLKQLCRDAWANWYEDYLSEYDSMYWATKGHFSISQLGFYNYPYLFGLLFSLGIYAKKNEYGADFHKLYVNILRDTGRMNAVDLIQTHFGVSIEEPEFWKNSLNIVEQSVKRFENTVG